MATTYSFTRTVPEMVDMVLRKLGAIGVGETASDEDVELVKEAINLRLKELHSLGILWFNVSGATTDVALVAGTATKSLSAVTDFLFAVSMKLRIGTDDQDIEIIGHREYQDIENKADTGEPEKVFVSGGTCYFWPTPDSNYTVKLTYQAIAADAPASSAPDVQQSMMRALAIVVAGDLTEEFEVGEPKASRMERKAKEALMTLLRLNSERVDNKTVEIEAF